MANIKQLVENKQKLDYAALCKALIEQFGVNEQVNWNSVLPSPQQHELFGGEVLRYVAEHPQLSKQKDIRPVGLKKGSVSQMLFFYVSLIDEALPKKQIEQITRRFIKGTEANRYIIWFFGNKNETALKVVLSAKEGKKIVLKTLPFGVEQPYYKTYDFILREISDKVSGKLFVEPTELWKALWKAFDISIVNKRFYEEIKRAFDSLLEQLNKKGNPFQSEEDQVQFAIRLIGRIIFCWFLKRKQILKDEVLSSGAVSNYEKKDYYHDLLEVLFFEVMNKPTKERSAGLPKLIARYPFLNGGLFDSQDTDFYTKGPDYRIRIDNTWFYTFFNTTLEKYNFTVDENSSSSEEIAIDPEMLGRIFENLLAEQNPETGESARKATGSYYTPREIVDYMVEQSIAEYLKSYLGNYSELKVEIKEDLFGAIPNQQLTLPKEEKLRLLGEWEEHVENFVHTNHLPDELKSIAANLSDALNKIKVLDPACGSGAFPIGVLQKIIALKQEILQIQNPKKQFNDADFYKLKLETIQNSIYGVDIQPMAVELSRLRCWLSLVVDEEINNIKSLPNLDFKFVCADSLVDVPENEYVRNQSEESLKEFAVAVEMYFNPDHRQKAGLRNTIKRYLNQITNAHDKAINQIITQLRKERNSATASRLKQLEKSLQDYTRQQSIWHSYKNLFENKKVDFFNIEYFFPSVKKGFDVIIGNPPYISHDKISKEFKNTLHFAYKSYEPFADLYCYFIERSINLLASNRIACLITSNSYLKSEYGKPLRDVVSEANTVLQVLSIEDSQVFESAIVNTAILITKKNKSNLTAVVVNAVYDFEENFEEFVSKNKFEYTQEDFKTKSWTLISPRYLKVLRDIEGHHSTLEKLNTKIRLGLATGDNDAFIISAKQREDFIKQDKKNREIIKPILRGRDIDRYSYHFPDLYILLTKNGIDVQKQYPTLYKYFDSLGPNFKNRGAKGQHWTNLRACSFFDDFKCEKIIWIELTDVGRFALCKEEIYLLNSAYFLLPPKGHTSNYLLGILNSKTILFYLSKTAETSGMGTSRWINNFVKEFPIPKPSFSKPIELLVDYILLLKQDIQPLNEFVPNEHISKQFEELIDACVYELYFEKEVKSKEAEVLQLAAQQFRPIAELNEPEKIKVIHEGYQLLRDSHNEIRNRITRQKLVEEIAIIQNSM